MKLFINRLRARLDTSIWLVPMIFIIGAICASSLVELADKRIGQGQAWYLFTGGPAGARSVLSVIAASVMTFMGLNFSVTMLVLQLASNQFSPSVLRTFLKDRGTQVVLGIFVGTFIFALLGLRIVRSPADQVAGYVPAMTVWLALILTLFCVISFVYFLHHIAQAIRVVNVLGRIGREALAQVERLYPESVAQPDVSHQRPFEREPKAIVRHRGASALVVEIDEEAIWNAVSVAKSDVSFLPNIGDFVPHGAALFEIFSEASTVDVKRLLDSVSFGAERDSEQDLAHTILQLVDVALRALSPGINDPNTAVQALDQIHAVLRALATRGFPTAHRTNAEGDAHLVLPRPSWTTYVSLALDEIRYDGRNSSRVMRRVGALVDDLIEAVGPDRKECLLERRTEVR